MIRIAMIGTGRLGTALGNALARAGCGIAALFDADPRAVRRARRIIGGGRIRKNPAAAAREADLVFIAVPDRSIPKVVRALVQGGFDGRGKMVFHTSGIETSARLAPLSARGAQVASFHPVQTVPDPALPPKHFRRSVFGLEGDPAAVEAAASIVRLLGGRPFVVSREGKPLYHAACVLASNLFIPLFDLAVKTMTEAGIPAGESKKALIPLVEGTLRNVKSLDAAEALTGPLARLDFGTVERHLRALKRIPKAREAYRVLGLSALELLTKRGGSALSIRRMRALLAKK